MLVTSVFGQRSLLPQIMKHGWDETDARAILRAAYNEQKKRSHGGGNRNRTHQTIITEFRDPLGATRRFIGEINLKTNRIKDLQYP